MTALPLLLEPQEAPMSRVEPKERPVKREAKDSRRHWDNDLDRKSAQAEGDERTAEEALRNQGRRR